MPFLSPRTLLPLLLLTAACEGGRESVAGASRPKAT